MRKENGYIAVVIGTRPEGIKLCPLVLAMRAHGLGVRVLASGQHGEMLSEVFSAFGMRPDLSMPPQYFGEDLTGLFSHLAMSLRDAFRSLAPSAVIVQGDTATAYAATLAAFLHRIPVVHVEAGLRSGDFLSPFPEEAFRKSIAAMASIHIAPTPQAMHHLWCEGVPKSRVFLLGNTVEDAVRHLAPRYAPRSRTMLLTLHRREHSEAQMRNVFAAATELLCHFPNYSLVYPMHPSPRVRRVAEAAFQGIARVRLVPPLPPRDFYPLLASAPLVLTDSGGVQEEASILGVPTLVLRENTEREYELQNGRIRLVGTDPARIVSVATELLSAPERKRKESQNGSPSERICKVLFAFKQCGFDMQRLCREF